MEDVNKLLKTAVDDIERVLNSKTVIGDPISVEGATIIPLVSIGFGFGAGGGSRNPTGEKENVAGGTGAGGGIKPVAVIIVDKEGSVRLQSLSGGTISIIEKVVDTVGKTVAKRMDKTPEPDKS